MRWRVMPAQLPAEHASAREQTKAQLGGGRYRPTAWQRTSERRCELVRRRTRCHDVRGSVRDNTSAVHVSVDTSNSPPIDASTGMEGRVRREPACQAGLPRDTQIEHIEQDGVFLLKFCTGAPLFHGVTCFRWINFFGDMHSALRRRQCCVPCCRELHVEAHVPSLPRIRISRRDTSTSGLLAATANQHLWRAQCRAAAYCVMMSTLDRTCIDHVMSPGTPASLHHGRRTRQGCNGFPELTRYGAAFDIKPHAAGIFPGRA